MKANPWLLPGAALLVTGGWIVSQRNSATTLEREIAVLTGRIQQARSVGNAEAMADGAGGKSRKDKGGKVNWKDIAGKMAQVRGGGGMGDMRTFMRLQKLLLDMSPDELCGQLDEIAALDLNDSERAQLRGTILGVLVDKDPKLALERFGNEINDAKSNARWHLQRALGKWAETGPAAAAAWLDGRIAAGVFESKSLDGKNENLLRFESEVVRQLLKSDPAAAAARVMALPGEQRPDFFQRGFYGRYDHGIDGPYAKLVRESLPAEKAGDVLADLAYNLAGQEGGYKRVDEFIVNTSATDGEKQSIVKQVMIGNMRGFGGEEIAVKDLERARSWGEAYSPDAVNKATGEILGDYLNKGGSFQGISETVLQYNALGGNDDVLASFLMSGTVRIMSPGKAQPLIDQVKDPALREEILALPEYQNQASEP